MKIDKRMEFISGKYRRIAMEIRNDEENVYSNGISDDIDRFIQELKLAYENGMVFPGFNHAYYGTAIMNKVEGQINILKQILKQDLRIKNDKLINNTGTMIESEKKRVLEKIESGMNAIEAIEKEEVYTNTQMNARTKTERREYTSEVEANLRKRVNDAMEEITQSLRRELVIKGFSMPRIESIILVVNRSVEYSMKSYFKVFGENNPHLDKYIYQVIQEHTDKITQLIEEYKTNEKRAQEDKEQSWKLSPEEQAAQRIHQEYVSKRVGEKEEKPDIIPLPSDMII